MNKCEIEDCELCAPLKGKYYHHAYENAKNVRFCNSNKTATAWNAPKIYFASHLKLVAFLYCSMSWHGPDFELHFYFGNS